MTTVSVGAPYPRLVGDIGGTHARFGWVESPTSGIVAVSVYASADHPGLEAAIAHYLVEHGHPPPAACAIGIATAVVGDHVAMTNRDWAFSVSAVRRSLGIECFVVLNDFTTLALALPGLTASDLTPVGRGSPVPGAPVGLLGPGTGLGVSGLLPAAAGPLPIAGEGGHAARRRRRA